tara:strand:+ start:3378 stop:3911 length:534 start_codon:yes stop_codon:yes gene_type:complete
MKLHLGCGDKIIDGFVNVDIRKNVGVDLIDDISLLSSIKNNSVDLIYACHVLEHFDRNNYEKVLKRWYEVLSAEGVLRLSVPDLGKVFHSYVEDGIELEQLMGFLYGGQTYKENYHYVGFDKSTLSKKLKNIGFKRVEEWNWRETDHSHIDDFSQAYIPHMDKNNGKLMSLNLIAVK